MKKFNIVGKPVARQDALEKVTGEAKFADDYKFPGMLYGVMVRVPAAHAKIISIDYSAALNDPAVAAIINWDDVPGSKKVGPIKQDQPVFCKDKIVTPGDVVAMLAGSDENRLRAISKKIKIQFEALPALTNPEKALDKNSPLIHPEFGSNLIVHYPLRKGNVEKGFAESDFILEQRYTTQLVEHAYIEPETVTAILLEGEKGIKIIGSIQNPFTCRKIVAAALGWPLAKVRVVQAELGGSFGGKDDTMNILSARAALAAIKTGRPVKIKYRREESILESYKRHPYILNYKVGYTKEGRLKAMQIDLLADGGAYSSMSPFVTWRSVVQATGPYEVENVSTDVRAVYTNNPYTGAMRGFGSPQPIFAQESIMDEIASRLNLTPDEIRKINGYKAGSVTASGQKLVNHEVTLHKVIETACAETDFPAMWRINRELNSDVAQKFLSIQEKTENSFLLDNDDFIAPSETIRKGIGMACSFRGCSLGAEGIDATSAYLSVQLDGTVYLLSGLAENGQGLRTTFSIIVSEVLGIPMDRIYYLELDTALIPDCGPTVASRSTLMGGGAVKNAAEKIRDSFAEALTEQWNLTCKNDLIFENNMVFEKSNPARKISFKDLCSLAYKKGKPIASIGWYKSPHVDWNEETGQGSAYFTYVYGCQVAEVSVNIITGEVYVDRVVAVHDPGKVINRLGAEGQVYGGVTQGSGYCLWEEITTQDGFIRELNFDQFLIPTSKDIGEIKPVFVEGEDPHGAWGGKSLGEPTLELTAAAIANAITNATGIRFFNLPLNIEEITLKRKLRPNDLTRGSAR